MSTTLVQGSSLGAYQILAIIGAGGMGEVYRARDARLARDVALKILPEHLAGDRDRLARFEREAQLLATLNHPHIAAVYGMHEDAGRSFIAMELVEGDTLAERIDRGGLRLDDVLEIARQIADALEAAHEKGIVHRDLKPANIKVTPEGRVKVLDFGLAKNVAAAPDVSFEQTMAAAPGSEAGLILGTAPYMSPEQARGRAVDKRTDIWAFGCVLFEMLAGRRAFAGETITDVLAAIVEREPVWGQLPPEASRRVGRLLRRCLEKDPKRRLHDIADARIEIEDLQRAPAGEPHAPPASPRGSAWWARPAWFLAGVAATAAALLSWGRLATPSPERSSMALRAALPLPSYTVLSLGRGSTVAFSADGRSLVFVATVKTPAGARRPTNSPAPAETTQLFMRPLDRLDATPLAGTEGATNPFFSPDGRWVGFFADGKLKKASIEGGKPVTLADAPNPRGESWGLDDRIVFTPFGGSPLVSVPAAGGKVTPVTKLAEGELSHRWPQVLPDGRSVLYTVWNDVGWEPARMAVASLQGGDPHVVVEGGGHGRYVSDPVSGGGYLVYARAEGLMAARFDLTRLEVVGSAVPILDGVITNLSGGAHFSVSPQGWLAYVPGELGEVDRDLVWVDRAGTEEPAIRVRGMSRPFSLSPDGTRVVRNNTVGTNRFLWTDDVLRGTTTQLPVTGNHADGAGVWSHDAAAIVFAQGLPLNLFRIAADGRGAEERLTTSANRQLPSSWSPDGRLLAYSEFAPGADIWLLDVPATLSARAAGREPGPETTRPFLRTPFSEGSAVFSPDGRWLAYQSNESGRFEICVEPVTGGGRKSQVSTDGGTSPAWSPNGRELFYRSRDELMVADVRAEAEFSATPPRPLFRGEYEDDFGVSPDGSRFLMMRLVANEAGATTIVLVSDWLAELRQRVR